MNINDIKSVYFVGAGGIGMSAIARYFLKKGLIVGGYDKTPSDLTRQLEKEGMSIHYEEDINQIPQACKNQQECLAVPSDYAPFSDSLSLRLTCLKHLTSPDRNNS